MLTLAQNPVLVLNKVWTPIGVKNLEAAMGKLLGTYADGTPKAKVIDPTADFATYTWDDWAKLKAPDGERVIRTRTETFRIPEVILLTRYDKRPDYTVKFSRRTIYRRDGYRCMYCGGRPGTKELSLDHILPKSRGGATTWENCTLACTSCNFKKANRTLAEAGMTFWKKDYKPTKPKFCIFRGDRKAMPKSWDSFISEVYWGTELENDMTKES